MIKMYAIFSRESIAKMKGNKGKMCAQAGHAYLHAWWDAERLLEDLHSFEDDKNIDEGEAIRLEQTMNAYRRGADARKIALIAETDADLLQLAQDYEGFTGVTRVIDAGYTVVEPGTMTCIGIGPLRDEEKGGDLLDLDLFIA